MLTFKFPLFSVLLLGLPCIINAASQKRDAYGPPITQPTADAVWTVGEFEEVTWDTSSVPADNQDSIVDILLAHPSDSSENLDFDNPLASSIPIMQGSATVFIPDGTPAGYGYAVVVFGTADNLGPSFTIVNSG